MKYSLFAFIFTLFISGCGISAIPLNAGSNSIDINTGTSIAKTGNVTITAKVLDFEVSPYVLSGNVTSFYITIENLNDENLSLPLSSFILFDNSGNQYRALDPSQVVSLAKASSDYLIPYPYVGYYYLGDKEQGSFENVYSMSTYSSSMSLPRQPYPDQILLESLPIDSVLPHGKISGSIYFPIDLYEKDMVELKIFPPESPPPAPAKFVFPFKISR